MKFFLAAISIFFCFLQIRGDDINFSVTLWMGNDIDSSNSKTFQVPPGTSVYNALQLAGKEDCDNFGLKTVRRGKSNYILKIGNWEERVEEKKFWMFYVLPSSPCNDKPPTAEDLSKKGVECTTVQENKHYLFWLRKHPKAKK